MEPSRVVRRPREPESDYEAEPRPLPRGRELLAPNSDFICAGLGRET